MNHSVTYTCFQANFINYWQIILPLLGGLIGALIPSLFTFEHIKFRVNKELNLQIHLRHIEIISQQLSEFYNPLYTLLNINNYIFNKFSPKTFPEEAIQRESASENWKILKKKVILPNNNIIADIIRTKSHLLSTNDDISPYLKLYNHLKFYEVFSERPTEQYGPFQFPEEILEHVKNHREQLLRLLNELREKK